MRRMLYIKLGFLTLLLVAGFVAFQFFNSRFKAKEAVLGKKTQIDEVQPSPAQTSSIEKTLKQAAETVQNITNEAAQNAVGVVGATTTRTVETVKEYIFDKTVGSALQQINNLPQDEKAKIKEFICK